MIQWDQEYGLLLADSMADAMTIAHPSGPRQVGVCCDLTGEEDLHVFRVHPDGTMELTHAPDHWGLPAWHADEDE